MADATINSQLRGNIWKIEVAVGDRVSEGQDLIIIESMKTEIPVTAPAQGVVQAILVEEGQAVDERQPLLTLAV